MMQKTNLLLALLALSASSSGVAHGEEVPASLIASGKPQWVASKGDKSVNDAMVDIGTMRQIGDVLEVEIRWPYLPDANESQESDKNHIICTTDHAISYAVEIGHISSDGQYRVKTSFDPAEARKKAEQRDAEWAKVGNGFNSYGSDPRSLACWAAARKCAGEAYTWPAPPNKTPLEYSDEARKMNKAYNLAFVPACTLK